MSATFHAHLGETEYNDEASFREALAATGMPEVAIDKVVSLAKGEDVAIDAHVTLTED